MLLLDLIKTIGNLFLKKPLLAVWNITDNCNQDCLYCNAHNNNVNKNNNYAQIPIEEIKQTIDLVKSLGIKYIYLQGGEPLLRKDITQILLEVLKRGIKPTVITNGTLLNQEFVDFISDKDINLSISLETLSPEKYKYLTRNNGLDEKLNIIKSLMNISHIGNWSISTTVTKINYEEIGQIEEFAIENNFMYVIRGYMYNIGDYGKFNPDLTYDGIRTEVKSIFNKFAQKSKKKNYPAYLIYHSFLEYLNGGKMENCDATRYSILINSDGSLSPCIEHTKHRINGSKREVLKYFKSSEIRGMINNCNIKTPCFHGCTRNIGVLYQNKFKLLLHFPKIFKTARDFNSFF